MFAIIGKTCRHVVRFMSSKGEELNLNQCKCKELLFCLPPVFCSPTPRKTEYKMGSLTAQLLVPVKYYSYPNIFVK